MAGGVLHVADIHGGDGTHNVNTGNGQTINLADHYNELPLEICGIPKGTIVCDNTVFYINEFGNFSIALEPGQNITISFAAFP